MFFKEFIQNIITICQCLIFILALVGILPLGVLCFLGWLISVEFGIACVIGFILAAAYIKTMFGD